MKLSNEYYAAFFKETILAELEELDQLIFEQDCCGIDVERMFELISIFPVISYKEKSYSLLYVNGFYGVYGIEEFDDESDDNFLCFGYNQNTKEFDVLFEGCEAGDRYLCDNFDYEDGLKNLVLVDLDMRHEFLRSKQVSTVC